MNRIFILTVELWKSLELHKSVAQNAHCETINPSKDLHYALPSIGLRISKVVEICIIIVHIDTAR
jgi:hypothetical protein